MSQARLDIERMLQRIRKHRDFPAFSSHVREIVRISSRKQSSANDLAAVILKDQALTQKILQVANSAHFGQFAGQIHTISRAVVILGFEQVRSVALGLMLFEHFRKQGNATPLLETMLTSIFSGLLARNVATGEDRERVEEIFICAMLHDLGRMAMAFYAPEHYAAVETAMKAHGGDFESTVRHELGFSPRELGRAIAREWGFPALVIHSLQQLPPSRRKNPATLEDRMRGYSQFANALAQRVAADPQSAEAAIAELLDDYGAIVRVEADDLRERMAETRDDFSHYLEALPEARRNQGVLEKLMQAPEEETEAEATPAPPSEHDTDHSKLMDGIADISETLLEPFDLNTLLVAILETLYSALPAERVLLFIVDRENAVLRPRFGFATNLDNLRRNLAIPTGGADNPFTEALTGHREFWVADAAHDLSTTNLPEPMQRWLPAAAFGIFPLVVNDRAIGAIYVDTARPGSLDATSRRGIRTLVKQAVTAIRTNR